MTISVKCPQCGHDYQLRDAAAGKRFQCRGCDTIISVPESDGVSDDPYGTAFDWDQEPARAKPRAVRKRAARRSDNTTTLLPAIAMYVSAGLYLPLILLVTVNVLLQPIDPADLPPPGPQRDGFIMGYRAAQIAFPLAISTCPLVEIIGAYHLHTHRSWKLALLGAILCCIPCLSPCVFLGIPIGIWALIVLNLDDVKSQFS